MNLEGKKVLVTGGAGFLGRSVVQHLQDRGVSEVVVPRRRDYDLVHEEAAIRLYEDHAPDLVFHLAAEVGGIGANIDNPGRYFFANMAMAINLIEQGRIHAGKSKSFKFVMAGTICAYPNLTPVPFKESDLWNGYPEVTNAPYGVAKKAAMVMLDGYHRQYGMASAFVMPVNLYGPFDNFHHRSSHVIPALIRKCVSARDAGLDHIVCWGTGSASREFLFVDDCAAGIVRAAEVLNDPSPINLGTCMEITIRDLVELIAKLSRFDGEIRWDPTKPDGQPRRCLDTSLAAERLDWRASVGFEDGLRRTIEWFEQNQREIERDEAE
ncbi:MAG: NAD-dependent epimerase/dehydratase family protein [Planctomycetia bacterium]|nr:NAD-dependent epimerase/dehydratase family protein [Planctomycetia bacterium]